jgi:hypothetical protein
VIHAEEMEEMKEEKQLEVSELEIRRRLAYRCGRRRASSVREVAAGEGRGGAEGKCATDPAAPDEDPILWSRRTEWRLQLIDLRIYGSRDGRATDMAG